MYLVVSVRPSVCLFVRPFVCQFVRAATSKEESLPVSGVCLCVSNQWAGANYCVDAVNRLLIACYDYMGNYLFFN